MIIDGVVWTVGAAALGGVLFEGLKLLDRWVKRDTTLGHRAVVWSAAMVVVGSLVPLIYGVKERNFLEVAQLGIAVPALITGGFKVAAKPGEAEAVRGSARTRSKGRMVETLGVPKSKAKGKSAFLRYAGWRF